MRLFLCHIQNTRWDGGITPAADLLSVYSLALVDRATGHSSGASYSAQMQSVYFTAPDDWARMPVKSLDTTKKEEQ